MAEVPRGGTTSLTQAYLGHKTNQIKQEFLPSPSSSSKRKGDEEAGFLDEYNEDGGDETYNNTQRTMWTSGVFIMAAGTLGANILIMVASGGVFTYIAGGFASVVAITVGAGELNLEDMPTESLRQVQNNLREDVDHFGTQNGRLTNNVNDLEKNVTGLKDTEQRLKDLTKQQDLNVKSLVKLVGESKEIANGMKRCVRLDIIGSLVDTALKGERDESGEFSDKEIKRLLIYMRGLPAVQVNEELLEQAIRKDRSMGALLNLILDIYRGGEQEGDSIFIIDAADEDLQAKVTETV